MNRTPTSTNQSVFRSNIVSLLLFQVSARRRPGRSLTRFITVSAVTNAAVSRSCRRTTTYALINPTVLLIVLGGRILLS